MNDAFLKAARGKKVDHVPVWFMRQAGRSLPGYRALRKKYGVLELAQTPELAAHVSLEPIERLGVDAAILFADIMLLPIAMGVDVKIIDAIGPVIDSPLRSLKDINKLRNFEQGNAAYLQQTIKILRNELHVPLIGFAGAPFTLASYLLEGKPSRTWSITKRFMLEESEAWDTLMKKLSDGIISYLSMQIDAGAQAVQLFDSWVGALSPSDYRRYVLPYVQRIFKTLEKKDVPRIHFGTNTAGLFEDFTNVDCEVIGLDWHMSLSAARKLLPRRTLQGNLDPVLLLTDFPLVQKRVDEMLCSINPHKRYIFNLGHGVLPETDDKQLKKLVEYIHETY